MLNHGLMISKELELFESMFAFFCPCTSLYSDDDDLAKRVEVLVKIHIIVLSSTCPLDFDKMRLFGLVFVLYLSLIHI